MKILGTNAGTLISLLTLIGMGFGVGVYYSNNQKNIDILEIQKKNYKEVKELELKIQEVQLENRELQLKLTGYEKEKK